MGRSRHSAGRAPPRTARWPRVDRDRLLALALPPHAAPVHLFDRLRNAVLTAKGVPMLYLPELFIRAQGMRVTRMMSDALGEELGV